MPDLIERETLVSKAIYMYGFGENKYIPLKAVDQAPTVDAVPVVRCKDCIYSHMSAWKYWCENENTPFYRGYSHQVKACDFCSYGERRNDDAVD